MAGRLPTLPDKSGTFIERIRRNRIRKTKAMVESLFYRIGLVFSLRDVLVSSTVCNSEQDLIASVRSRRQSKFFFDIAQKQECVKRVSESEKARSVTEADMILAHEFKIFGHTFNHGDSIDWHLDPVSGYRWPLKYYKRLLPVFNVIDNTDGKFPYELSRLNHFSVLGRAYWLTGDEKYAREFVNESESWFDNNPYLSGINWTCAMDVAFRACNILAAWHYFKESTMITDSMVLKLTKSMHYHGLFIERNLEFAGNKKTNHYLSNIVGLAYLGLLMPELKTSSRWLDFAVKALIEEMGSQIHDDGSDYEGSTCYHRLVLELLFYSTLLIVINDKTFEGSNHRATCEKVFGISYTEKLYKMFEVVLYALKPDGRMPQIGDNDSGRLHGFGTDEVLDMRYLLTLGAIFFWEPKFKVKEFGFSLDALWVFGQEGFRTWLDLEESELSHIGSKSFPDAGWYIIRSGKDYCFISCGPNGGDGWHSHNDKLSIELVVDGKDVIVDPGTYVYTSLPRERNKFRSTGYHNTVMVEGCEQNDIPEKVMFSLPDRVKIEMAELTEGSDEITFQGQIRYKDVVHARTVTLMRKTSEWRITDRIESPANATAKLLFHLSPDVTFDNGKIISRKDGQKIAILEVEGHELIKNEYDYSPEYGVKEKACCVAATFPSVGSRVITTTVRTYRTQSGSVG